MKLIREIETKHILNIYNSMSAQQLLDYILSYHNDSDCKYIFDNLPQKLQDRIDELAGEQIAEVRKQIVERDQQIADVIKKREEIDRNIEKIQKERIEVQKQSAIIKQFNIDMDNKNYILERQIEDMKELNRQF
jgi:TRAP-type C4-dicarboxylate transport system substrate-binding protein